MSRLMKRPLCICLGCWYALASTLDPDPAYRISHWVARLSRHRASGTATPSMSHSPLLSMMGFKSANQRTKKGTGVWKTMKSQSLKIISKSC